MKLGTRLLGLVAALLLIAAADGFLPASAQAAVSSTRIRNLAYDQCMGAPDTSLNVVLRILPCDSGPGFRRWYIDQGPGRSHYLRNAVGNQYCAEVNQGTAVPGELVDAWYCNGTSAEQWEIVPTGVVVRGHAYFRLRHVLLGTNLCLDTVGSEGSQLMQWNCEPYNAAQLWTFD
jgi:hypothetical protein